MLPSRVTSSPTPSGRRGSDAKRKVEIEWERVMVQITFAFVIILGYLVSVGLDEAQQLAAETESSQRRNQQLEAVLAELRGTEIGEARARFVAAERKLQLEQLLRIWAEVRVDRPLYALLRQFARAELVPLTDDLGSLPTGEGFQDLSSEARRVFLSSNHTASPAEVGRLMEIVLRRADFDLEAAPSALEPGLHNADVAALYHDQGMPDRENLLALRGRILSDLTDERAELSGLQYALIGKIAKARRDKLFALPLSDDAASDVDSAQLGVAMLDRVLVDLRERMSLLPETAALVRNGMDGAQDSLEP